MRISDWSSDVCSSDLIDQQVAEEQGERQARLSALGRPPHHPGGDADGDEKQRPGDRKDDVGGRPVRLAQARVPGLQRRPGDRRAEAPCGQAEDRTSVWLGKSVSVSVDHGGRRIIKKKKNKT